MTTLGELLVDVKAKLDESGVSRAWPNEDLRRWIMEGARDMARRSETLQSTDSIAIVAGTNEYTCPADVVRIHRAIWVPTGSTSQYPLEPEDFNDMDAAGWTWTTANGFPCIYTLWGFAPNLKIILYPTPSAAGEVRLWYYKFPTDLASNGDDDTETVDLPGGWQDAVAAYCEMVALRKDGDQRWMEARQLYEGTLNELIDRSRRWTDQAGAIAHNNTWLPGWLYNPDWYS